jgi:hypothetical protein
MFIQNFMRATPATIFYFYWSLKRRGEFLLADSSFGQFFCSGVKGGSTRVSSEISFVSKQPKLEPKLVSALSETRCLFRLFRFNIETGSFGVSKQPKQTKEQPKQQEIC